MPPHQTVERLGGGLTLRRRNRVQPRQRQRTDRTCPACRRGPRMPAGPPAGAARPPGARAAADRARPGGRVHDGRSCLAGSSRPRTPPGRCLSCVIGYYENGVNEPLAMHLGGGCFQLDRVTRWPVSFTGGQESGRNIIFSYSKLLISWSSCDTSATTPRRYQGQIESEVKSRRTGPPEMERARIAGTRSASAGRAAPCRAARCRPSAIAAAGGADRPPAMMTGLSESSACSAPCDAPPTCALPPGTSNSQPGCAVTQISPLCRDRARRRSVRTRSGTAVERDGAVLDVEVAARSRSPSPAPAPSPNASTRVAPSPLPRQNSSAPRARRDGVALASPSVSSACATSPDRRAGPPATLAGDALDHAPASGSRT